MSWLKDYEKLWMQLPVKTVADIVAVDSPTLAEFKLSISRFGTEALNMILVFILNSLRELVNVGKNLTDPQIGYIAAQIASDYWYFKFEDIKYVLTRAISTKKLYDRLDANIVLQWFAEYDAERTEVAVSISEQKDGERLALQKQDPGISLDEYIKELRAKGEYDEEAASLLQAYTDLTSNAQPPNPEARKKAFKKWYYSEYLNHN